uniref:Uncharacterized protein n=1 Tax=Anguilla anguilla TaxID=7936 RepID=A0A0E9QDY8_ANGAN
MPRRCDFAFWQLFYRETMYFSHI